MTTINQKKNYKTPHCVFVSLEEEIELLAVSNPVEEGDQADKGYASIVPQRDRDFLPESPWGTDPWE